MQLMLESFWTTLIHRMHQVLSTTDLCICWSPYLRHQSFQFTHTFSGNFYVSFRAQFNYYLFSFRNPFLWMHHTEARLIALNFSFKCSKPSIHNKPIDDRSIILLIMHNLVGNQQIFFAFLFLGKTRSRISANCFHINFLLTLKKVNKVLRKVMKYLWGKKTDTLQLWVVISKVK